MEVARTTLPTIAHFRKQFLEENNMQFIFDKCHRYGWADTYLFTNKGEPVGYGSVWGKDKRDDRDSIFEFYLTKDWEHLSHEFFIALCKSSGAKYIECQSNDRFTYPMFEKFAHDTSVEAILFADNHQTDLSVEGASINYKEQTNPDNHQYVLIHDGVSVGAGGFLLNYNFPYADIYYEIHESHRRRGLGSYLVQELKKEIYKMGRVPSARCDVNNTISKATLLKAGMIVCGLRVNGDIHLL